MTKKPKIPGKVVEPEAAKKAPLEVITLTSAMSQRSTWQRFGVWLVFDAPLITHAWSEKAKREMLAKMVKAVKAQREERNPRDEFESSLYRISDGVYGFPVTAVKKAVLSYAHKDRGIAKTTVMAGLWLDYDIVSQRPALAGAICDMPLVRIWGNKPQMREDMVRINGTSANFAYRAQFFPCALRLTGKIDPQAVPPEVLAFLVEGGGRACGIGDWRTEKSGVFGSFHMADAREEAAWNRFAAGKGPVPSPTPLLQAAE
jgi:hypothetical protein